jgi:hypothetical protein
MAGLVEVVVLSSGQCGAACDEIGGIMASRARRGDEQSCGGLLCFPS